MICEFFVVIIGRFLAVFISYYLFACCKSSEGDKLTVNQVAFIAYAALIRGAIAFGLSQELDPDRFGSHSPEIGRVEV